MPPLLGLLLQKGGRWGSIGVIVAGLADVLSGFGLIPESAAHGLGWVGLGILGMSLTWHVNRGIQMQAVTQAENKIQNPGLAASSADPAVQREIERQLSEPNGARPTPVDGTSKPGT